MLHGVCGFMILRLILEYILLDISISLSDTRTEHHFIIKSLSYMYTRKYYELLKVVENRHYEMGGIYRQLQ